ncbi:MAG: alcohol dehydrogenase catalytic domain-containing protein [Deltaproteobacteria bacterium]|nr:alcohol dehydrogenase catalytic domain-containing protein [Deltaproteobacteria bacterium]
MRAAVYHNNHDIRLAELPEPEPGPGELRMRIEASGICGSDVVEWYRVRKAPLVLGHEVAGTVEAVGEGVTRWRPGDRIVAAHHVPCNTCRHCLAGHPSTCDTLRTTTFDPGGFCERVRLPALNVDRGTFRLPDELSFDEGTFAEPLACVLRAQRLAGGPPGRSVLVLGSGLAGLLHLRLAAALGAGRLLATDLLENRREAARQSGADAVFDGRDDVPRLVREANGGAGADLVVVCADAPEVYRQAFASVERGGTVLVFALPTPDRDVPLPLYELWRDGVTLTSSYAGPPRETAEALELLRAGRVRVADLITHRLPLAETPRGFALVAAGRDCIKVIIRPQE